jgi:hypothetical protein
VPTGYSAVTCARLHFTDTRYSYFTLLNSLICSLSVLYVSGRPEDVGKSVIASKITQLHDNRLIMLSASQIMQVVRSYQRIISMSIVNSWWTDRQHDKFGQCCRDILRHQQNEEETREDLPNDGGLFFIMYNRCQ